MVFAFSTSQNYKIAIGVTTLDEGNLTNQFIGQLKNDDYSVIRYDSISQCINELKLKATNLCIEFPENFVLENNKTNEIEFYVDQSRINIVDSIISSVTSNMGLKSDEITLSLTKNLLDALNVSSGEVKEDKAIIDDLKPKVSSVETNTEQIKSRGEVNSMGTASTDLSKAKENLKEIDSSSDNLNTKIVSLLGDLDSLLDDLEGDNSTVSKLDKVREHYSTLIELLPLEVGDIDEAVDSLEETVSSLSGKIDKTNRDLLAIKNSASTIGSDVGSIQEKINELEESLQIMQDKISGLQITSAKSIVNPFSVNVNSIVVTSGKSTYMFPYYLTLVILFVGIVLSSSLVVMEKKSRAFFRTFTTPTKEFYHFLAGYITTFMVLFAQLSVILAAAFFYLKIPLLDNWGATLVILILSISLFVLIGTVLGHLFETQEGATIASISMGSLFLFLSNVILPIESFPEILRKIISIGPYTLCAELFKKALFFKAGFIGIRGELLLLLEYVALLLVFVFIFQRVSLTSFFWSFTNRKILRMPHVTKDNYFRLDDGTLLKDKTSLRRALKKISDQEFSYYVNEKNNEFAVWIKEAFKEKALARMINKVKSKKEMIEVLAGSEQKKKSDVKKVKRLRIRFRFV